MTVVAHTIRKKEKSIGILSGQALGSRAIAGDIAAGKPLQEMRWCGRKTVCKAEMIAQASEDTVFTQQFIARGQLIVRFRMDQESRPPVEIGAHDIDAA